MDLINLKTLQNTFPKNGITMARQSIILNYLLFLKTTLDHGPFHIHNRKLKKINLMGYKNRRNYGNVEIDGIDGLTK